VKPDDVNVPGSPVVSATGKAEAIALGITETLIAFPELKPIFQMFAAGNIAKARLAYFNSKIL
jgi:hypothetical protein